MIAGMNEISIARGSRWDEVDEQSKHAVASRHREERTIAASGGTAERYRRPMNTIGYSSGMNTQRQLT